MISVDHLKVLTTILQESCQEGVVPREILFNKFEKLTESGIQIYKFKKALSFFIKNGMISGYAIKPGRNGGVYKIPQTECISITCSSGKFIGNISKQELSKVMSNLKRRK